jgi:hypothetical protein
MRQFAVLGECRRGYQRQHDCKEEEFFAHGRKLYDEIGLAVYTIVKVFWKGRTGRGSLRAQEIMPFRTA